MALDTRHPCQNDGVYITTRACPWRMRMTVSEKTIADIFHAFRTFRGRCVTSVFNSDAFVQKKKAKRDQDNNKPAGNDKGRLNINIRHAYQAVTKSVDHI